MKPMNLAVSAGALCILAGSAAAQPTIDWYTVDGGGGTSTGGTYSLSGTIGQPDAGVMTGGTYTLTGGFWGGTVAVAPPCDPDLNQDGNVDQDDVSYLINVIGGGANPSGIDPDFNRDGNADQDDVLALINVIAGAPCQ